MSSLTPDTSSTASDVNILGDLTGINGSTVNPDEIMNLLRHLPSVFNKLVAQQQAQQAKADGSQQGSQQAGQGSQNIEAVAETLSNFSQQANLQQQQSPTQSSPIQQGHVPYPAPTHFIQQQPVNDPGPSTHPHGPPMMMNATSTIVCNSLRDKPQQQREQNAQDNRPQQNQQSGTTNDGNQKTGASFNTMDAARSLLAGVLGTGSLGGGPLSSASRKRVDSNGVSLGSEEWARKRKDNHKEVERRRRGNINEGISELARIVPNGNGERAKGAILSRAVQYIHHLKENEARNIEKWTLEKLLMDQAMGDLQGQLDDWKAHCEQEHKSKRKALKEMVRVKRLLKANRLSTATGEKMKEDEVISSDEDDFADFDEDDYDARARNKRARLE